MQNTHVWSFLGWGLHVFAHEYFVRENVAMLNCKNAPIKWSNILCKKILVYINAETSSLSFRINKVPWKYQTIAIKN